MYFGCNEARYSDVAPHVPNISMVRTYFSRYEIPNPWPATPLGTIGLATFYLDRVKLLSGALDAKLSASLATAPAGTWVSIWHEVNHRPEFYGKQADVRAAYARMLSLTRAANPSVKVGAILNDASSGLAGWVIDGLDFYAVDIYEGSILNSVRDVSEVLNRNFNQLPSTGLRGIGETNSCTPAHRPAWFREEYDWLYTHNGGAMLTFWNPEGAYSGPWLDSDAATIYSLQRISHSAKRGSM